MTGLSRRSALALFPGLVAMGLLPAGATENFGMTLEPGLPFDADMVVDRARALAAAPYAPPPPVSDEWRSLSYDQFKGIWFDTRNALYRRTASAVQAEFFPAGLYFTSKIAINAVTGGQAHPVQFERRVFDMTDRFPDLPDEGTGFSGFRLLGELETAGVFQEYVAFQGASYFRAIAKGLAYGLSARGLALDTATATPEEFPLFREFWIEEAAPGAKVAVVHALLDSPSVAGAFRFAIAPGQSTVMEVDVRLFPRRDLTGAGIAPGTSMFLFNDLNRAGHDDFREAVHDSDGLLMRNGAGETLWRPLKNPAVPETSAFADQNPRGFGLMQRARGGEADTDLVAHYERRPSLWVEPLGDWGPGQVRLVEIPTDKEINDNIVAFWHPAAPLAAGQEHRFAYRLHWCADAPDEGAVARVVSTRGGARVFEPGRIFAIDFAAHPILGDDPTDIEVRASASAGELSLPLLQVNPATGGMRLDLTLRPPETGAVELRAALWRAGTRLSEVWLYRWSAA
jgi:periplasmic glucans biosynthesis protein